MSIENKIPEEEKGENSSHSPEENSEPIEPSIQSEEAPQPEISNIKPENEIMEVHHHGHVHEKKKWKEYLFQFFMLFLAVFCGFLAEYQLEHIIENKREKQFMVSLVKDLERDTSQLESIIKARIRWIRDIDSAISFTTAQKSDHIPLEKVQSIYSGGLRSFYQNSGTLDQLKNAGGFRLIRKRNIVDSIGAYDRLIKRMVLRDEFETDGAVRLGEQIEKMLDGRMLAKIYADTTFHKKPPPAKTTRIPINNAYMNEYLLKLINRGGGIRGNMFLQLTMKSKATNLITLIKKEYHL
jgi:hypothetical protein